MSVLLSIPILLLRNKEIHIFLILSLLCTGNKTLALDNILPFFFMSKVNEKPTTLPYTLKDFITSFITLTSSPAPKHIKTHSKTHYTNKNQTPYITQIEPQTNQNTDIREDIRPQTNNQINKEIKPTKTKKIYKLNKKNKKLKRKKSNRINKRNNRFIKNQEQTETNTAFQHRETLKQITGNITKTNEQNPSLKTSRNKNESILPSKSKSLFSKKGALLAFMVFCQQWFPIGTLNMGRMICKNGSMLQKYNEQVLNNTYYGSVTEIPSLKKAKFALDLILRKNNYQGQIHYCDIDGQHHEVGVIIDYSNQDASICEHTIKAQIEIAVDAKLESVTLTPDSKLTHFKAKTQEQHFDMNPNNCDEPCNIKQANNYERNINDEVTLTTCPTIRDLTTKTVFTCKPSGNYAITQPTISSWKHRHLQIVSNDYSHNPDLYQGLTCRDNNSKVIKSTQLTITPSGAKQGSFKFLSDDFTCSFDFFFSRQEPFDRALFISIWNLPNPHKDCALNNVHEMIHAADQNNLIIPASVTATTIAMVMCALLYCWKTRTLLFARANTIPDAETNVLGGLIENVYELQRRNP